MNSKRDIGEWERRFHERITDQLDNIMNRSMKRNLLSVNSKAFKDVCEW